MQNHQSQHKSILIDGQVGQDHWHHFCTKKTTAQSVSITDEKISQGIGEDIGEEINKPSKTIFPFAYWLENRMLCLAHKGSKGITCKNTDDISQLKADIQALDLICLDFPIAADGRAYSQAHLIRQRYGFEKELRATGDIEVDQLFLMTRCGINAFAFSEDIDLIQASKYLKPFSFSYQ